MSRPEGFSLIELLIVVAVIGIIAALAVPNRVQSKKAANEASAIASVRNLVTAQITFAVLLVTGAGLMVKTFTTLRSVDLGFEAAQLLTFEVTLQGIFTMSDFVPIGEAMHGLDNQIRLRTPAPLPVERLTLSASHGFIRSRVDGTCAASEVLAVLPQHD